MWWDLVLFTEFMETILLHNFHHMRVSTVTFAKIQILNWKLPALRSSAHFAVEVAFIIAGAGLERTYYFLENCMGGKSK